MKFAIRSVLFTILLQNLLPAAVEVTVTHQSERHLNMILDFSVVSPGDLVPYYLNVGLPSSDLPSVTTEYMSSSSVPFAPELEMDHGVRWVAVQKHKGLHVGTLEIVPWTDSNLFNSRIEINITFPEQPSGISRSPGPLSHVLSQKIINAKTAIKWKQKQERKTYKKTEDGGQWFNFKVSEDGIYKISGDVLLELSPLFQTTDPALVKFFTNSQFGRSQPDNYNQEVPENLVEVAVQFIGDEDEILEQDEYFSIYASGPDGYYTEGGSTSFSKNLFFTENNCWILVPEDTSTQGKRITVQKAPLSDGLSISTGYRRLHIENDLVNPFRSGLAWAGKSIGFQGTHAVDLFISSVSPSGNATLSYRFLGGNASYEDGSSPLNRVEIRLGSSQNDVLASASWYGYAFRSGSVTIPGNVLASSTPRLFIKNISTSSGSEPMLDYIDLKYESDLKYDQEPLTFYPPENVGGIFSININTGNEIKVWNVSDPSAPIEMDTDWVSGTPGTSFFKTVLSADSLQKFIAFRDDEITEISEIESAGQVSFSEIRNNNISARHIILGPKSFRSAATPLTDHRSNSIFVSLESVYREFSGGNIDPYAIRNFIQWTQEYWQAPACEELFILGDADYDYRNITGKSNITVPTIESGTTNSYASDDFLAAVYGPIPEIALGRLPVSNPEDVSRYVKKLIQFETDPELGLWRQKVTLVADDGARPEPRYGSVYVGKSHTLNSETLAELVPGMVGLKKFYLLEYPEVSDASSYGVVKPSATEDLLKLLTSGTALINYIGHGSAHQWAQERLLVQDRDLPLINTGMKLPIWVAGTCSWGHFDDMDARSFAEDLINLDMNGAAAIITTSRAISVSGNAQYTTDLFSAFFSQGGVSGASLGTLLHSIKTPYRESRYFHLFGDPGMPFTIPNDTIEITGVFPDTLKTLETGTFSGVQRISAGGGTAYAVIQDSDYRVTRAYNISSTTESLSYTLPGRDLFRGKIDVGSESFTGQVRIPLDISYSNQPGKLRLYFISNDNPVAEALGYIDNFYLAGGKHVEDNQGPIISLQSTTGRVIRSGDHVFSDEEIFIKLQDPLGINTASEIGHEISLVDETNGKKFDLTEFFTYDNNSITEGYIPLPETGTSDKIHINIKAWDSANNPNEKGFLVHLREKQDLGIFQVYNFPNPFASSTRFQFEITQPAEISVEIFTVNGRKIYRNDKKPFPAGTHYFEWDGKDAYGDEIANGVYLFRIKAQGDVGSVSHLGQIAKFR